MVHPLARLCKPYDPLIPVDLRSYRDKEKGRAAWVLGTGTSVLDLKPSELQGDCIIAVNHSIWVSERLGFPMVSYWLFGDIWIPMEIEVERYPTVAKWTAHRPACYLMGQQFSPTDHGLGNSFVNFNPSHSLKMELDQEKLLYRMSTVQGAIHMAWMLGCDPIHVRGVDLGPDDHGQLHWYGQPGEVDMSKPCNYGFQHDGIHAIVQAVKDSGRMITVRGAQQLEEPYVPSWEIPMPTISMEESIRRNKKLIEEAERAANK